MRTIKHIFRRDFIIAILIAWIFSLYLEGGLLMIVLLIIPAFVGVLEVEELIDKAMNVIHLRRVIKKLVNRKVLPPTKARQD